VTSARRCAARIALILVCGQSAVAAAADPINSSDKVDAQKGDVPAETQFNLLPVVGGTTDIGFGVGEFLGITRVRKGRDPYVWNITSAGLVTFKPSNPGIIVPYQDVWVQLSVPRLFGSASELTLRPGYTLESTLGYYGLGNASSDTPPPGQSSSYFWYQRRHPSILVDLRWRIVDHVAAHIAARYTQNWIQVPEGSKLAADLQSPDPEVRKLLGSTAPHGVGIFTYGLQWDNRDSVIAPHRGQFHEALVRLSPGGTPALPYRYGQANLDARFYVPLASRRVTLAVRAVGDVLFGDPPLYELARFDDAYALGGQDGVRGVPAQRYSGKVKVFGNAELRVDVMTFHALGKKLLLGVVGFFDAGRLWADTSPHPELDGTAIGLKYGVGGGLRLQSGQAFVMRADIAWSPDARPIGGYFAAGEIF
jgi:hypothetical protein